MSIATTSIAIHEYQSIFPVFPIGSILVCLLLLGYYFSSKNKTRTIILAIGISVVFKLLIHTFPASLVGLDPDLYAVWIRSVVDSGHLYGITDDFYSKAPNFILLNAIFKIISDLGMRNSLLVFPFILGVIPPLTAVIITRDIVKIEKDTAVVLAALLTATLAMGLRYSYIPIAQSLGAAFWYVIIILLLKFRQSDNRFVVLVILLLCAELYTHKLPPLVLVILITLISLFEFAIKSKVENRSYSNLSIIVGFVSGVLLLLQWLYITPFISDLFGRLLAILTFGSTSISNTLPEYRGAVRPVPRAFGTFLLMLSGIGLLLPSGISWVRLFVKRRQDWAVRVTLLAAALLVGFMFFGIYGSIGPSGSSGGQPVRYVFLAEPILVGLVAALTVEWGRKINFKLVLYLALTLLIITQVFSISATPDHPASSRIYLTEGEVTGKVHISEYTTEEVYADQYFLHETPPTHIGENRGTYADISEPLLNRTLEKQRFPYIAYRSDLSVYRTEFGSYRIQYNPESYLDRHYGKIYTNNEVTLYSGV